MLLYKLDKLTGSAANPIVLQSHENLKCYGYVEFSSNKPYPPFFLRSSAEIPFALPINHIAGRSSNPDAVIAAATEKNLAPRYSASVIPKNWERAKVIPNVARPILSRKDRVFYLLSTDLE